MSNVTARLKNYGLWVAIASLVLIVLQNAGVPIVPEKYNIVVNAVLGILSTLGILSNPLSGKGFVDAPQAVSVEPIQGEADGK